MASRVAWLTVAPKKVQKTRLRTRRGEIVGYASNFAKVVISALGGTRTPNLLIRSQMLSPIELRALEGRHHTGQRSRGES